jgi:hypothetical protein
MLIGSCHVAKNATLGLSASAASAIGRIREGLRPSQVETTPRHQAGFITGRAVATDVGSHVVDGAGDRNTNLAEQSRTAVARAAHTAKTVIDELARNTLEVVLIFRGEARPIPRKCATGPTSPAGRRRRSAGLASQALASQARDRQVRPLGVFAWPRLPHADTRRESSLSLATRSNVSALLLTR